MSFLSQKVIHKEVKDNWTQRKICESPKSFKVSTSLCPSEIWLRYTCLSGETSLNSSLLSGFTCERNDAANTNCPIVLPNLMGGISVDSLFSGEITYPDKNALYGKLLTRMQYTNWTMPESIKNSRKESINLSRSGVFSVYAFHNVSTAFVVVDGAGFGAIVGTEESWSSNSDLVTRFPIGIRTGKRQANMSKPKKFASASSGCSLPHTILFLFILCRLCYGKFHRGPRELRLSFTTVKD